MAEVPEHLLKRSQERRKALGLPVEGEDGDDATTPAEEAPAADAGARRAASKTSRPPRPTPARRSPKTRAASPRTCSSVRASARPRSRAAAAARPRRRGGAAPDARPQPRSPRPRRPAPVRAVTRSACSPSSSRVRSSRRAPKRRTRCTCGRTCSHRVRVDPLADGVRHDLLRAGEGAAARPRRRQPDAEPVEGAVVLPRSARAAEDVPPDGRRCDASRASRSALLAITPYIDKNPSNKPDDRKFAIIMMTMFLMMWAVLVIIGSFFRGRASTSSSRGTRRHLLRACRS